MDPRRGTLQAISTIMEVAVEQVREVRPGFDATVYRSVISNFMSGVVVITTTDRGRSFGMTVSAVSSLSLEPPMLLVCLNSTSSTQEAVRNSGRFAVNILADDQGHLAARFARSAAAGEDKFAGIGYRVGVTGAPLLDGTLAVVECRVAEVVTGGTHRIFLGEVVHAEAREGSPLAYFRGKFGKLEMAQDADVYARLRELVIGRTFAPDQTLEVETLAEQLGASPSSVYYALTRLVGEDLVTRDPDRGHVVKPLDAATSDDINDAKLAIELGAAELSVGRLSDAQLAEFRRLAEATAAFIGAGQFVDLRSYIDANNAFHTFMIEATGVAHLVQAYQRLSLSEVMARALTPSTAVSSQLAEDHLELVEAYAQADLARAKEVITRHNERAKQTQRAGIASAGGRL